MALRRGDRADPACDGLVADARATTIDQRHVSRFTIRALIFACVPATYGARIFYVQHSGDHYDLMQSPAGGGTAQPMDAPFPGSLIWDVSPDGRNYLLTTFRRRGEPGPLWSWPTTGGPPMKLGDIVSGSASYSTDGKQIAYHLGTTASRLTPMARTRTRSARSRRGSRIRPCGPRMARESDLR